VLPIGKEFTFLNNPRRPKQGLRQPESLMLPLVPLAKSSLKTANPVFRLLLFVQNI
jgi:hypothetical protein